MLRLLFATDTMFHGGDDGSVLTDGALLGPVWQQYLEIFDELIVVGRKRPRSRPAMVSATADADRVGFVLLRNFNGVFELVRRFEAVRSMAELVARSDAVVARLPTEIGLLACAAARRAGKPILVEVVGSAAEAFRFRGSRLARMYAPIIHRRMQRAVRHADIALYVTQRWLQSQYPSPNPAVAWEGLCDVGASETLRGQAGIADAIVTEPTDELRSSRRRRLRQLEEGRPPVFGTIASLGPLYKGIQFALPAFAELARSGRRFEYRILGPGDPAPWLKMIGDLGLESCCHLDGVRQPGAPILEWLDEIDVHLAPSLTESLSRSTVEAMSRGVACLASSAGGLPEYLSPEQLHRPGDVAHLTAHIRALLDNPASIARLSDFSLERVERFNRGTIEGRRRYLYQRLADMCRPNSGGSGGKQL